MAPAFISGGRRHPRLTLVAASEPSTKRVETILRVDAIRPAAVYVNPEWATRVTKGLTITGDTLTVTSNGLYTRTVVLIEDLPLRAVGGDATTIPTERCVWRALALTGV